MNKILVSSEKDLRVNATTILRRINAADKGGLLFLLNPVLALEEAGVQLSPHMNRHIRTGLKYGAEEKQKIKKIEGEMVKLAGGPINVGSNAEVSRLLFEKLKVTPLTKAQLARIKTAEPASSIYELDDDPVPLRTARPQRAPQDIQKMNTVQLKAALRAKRQPVGGNKAQLIKRMEAVDVAEARPATKMSTEVLMKMKSRHPAIPKILELRKLYEQSGWQFVNRGIFEQVKEGMGVSLVKAVRFKTDRRTTRRPSASRRTAQWKPKTKMGAKALGKFKKQGSIVKAVNKSTAKKRIA